MAIDAAVPSGQDLVIRYRLVSLTRMARGGAPDVDGLGTRLTAYHLRIVPRDVVAVRFEESKEDNE